MDLHVSFVAMVFLRGLLFSHKLLIDSAQNERNDLEASNLHPKTGYDIGRGVPSFHKRSELGHASILVIQGFYVL